VGEYELPGRREGAIETGVKQEEYVRAALEVVRPTGTSGVPRACTMAHVGPRRLSSSGPIRRPVPPSSRRDSRRWLEHAGELLTICASTETVSEEVSFRCPIPLALLGRLLVSLPAAASAPARRVRSLAARSAGGPTFMQEQCTGGSCVLRSLGGRPRRDPRP